MSIILKSQGYQKKFVHKSLINIGTNPKCDFVLELDYDVLITVRYDERNNVGIVANNFKNSKILFEGQQLERESFKKKCNIAFSDSNLSLEIEIEEDTEENSIDNSEAQTYTPSELSNIQQDIESEDIKIKLEKSREPIEKVRTAIIKQVAYPIADLKNKIKINWRTGLVMHVALYITSLLSSFAIANYLMGLSVQESVRNVYLATNIPVWFAYSFVVMAICLMLKQGVFLHLNEIQTKKASTNNRIAKNFMLWVSSIFIVGIYTVNLTYYSAISDFEIFSVFITMFFVGIMASLAIACGYFKTNGANYGAVLHKYEFREDFETAIKAYRIWIERYANSLSENRIAKIKDKLWGYYIKSAVITIAGLFTTPFLAYGVSNTLAICFPEAANWVRILGFRFSPIFLTLSTFLIIFAFFALVNGFMSRKKIQASEVIKQDGFTDFTLHGATIYGLEGTRKLESDKKLAFYIASSIVLIEFMMNMSYFMSTTGEDIKSVALSFLTATVPTALLLAETFILAGTKFDIFACEDMISRIDKE